MNRLIFIFLGLLISLPAFAELAYVINPKCSIESITVKDLEYLFLSKSKYLKNGKRARPIELSSTETKNKFYLKVAGKNEVELRKYWATVVFTGHGKPPKQFHTSDKLIAYLLEKKCSISYLPKNALSDSIKSISLIE